MFPLSGFRKSFYSIVFNMMFFKGMSPRTCTKFEILWSIIFSILIYMMYHFPWLDTTTQYFLHNKTMFRNIFLFPRKLVLWFKNIPVSISVYSVFSSRRFTDSNNTIFGRMVTFIRTKFISMPLKFADELSFTSFANVFHNVGVVK